MDASTVLIIAVPFLSGALMAGLWNRHMIDKLRQQVGALQRRMFSQIEGLRYYPAVWWVCPACEKESFTKCDPMEITNEDREGDSDELADAVTGDVWVDPSEFTCPHCGSVYWGEPERDEDEEEGDE